MIKTFFSICILTCFLSKAQTTTIELPYEKPDNVHWKGKEHQYFSTDWKTDVITNISIPTIDIYSPSKELNTGTAVVIAPGGALYANSITTEGTLVAKWLVKKGITAIILKYRLVPTRTNDGVAELKRINKKNKDILHQRVAKVIPYAIEDALNAIYYVREHAKKLAIQPNKIGFMGFSAGGAITMGVAYNYLPKNRPNFLVPVYPWTSEYPIQKPKSDAPPMLIFCATNDPLKLAMGSINLYRSWKEANLNVSLHMYAKGRHGFGMRQQNLPSDTWINRFYEWALSEQLVTL